MSKARSHCRFGPLDGLHIVARRDYLRLYQFGTDTAEHYVCSHCGVYTHHRRRSNPNEYGFNLGCLEGVNPYELGEVPVLHGVRRPADYPGETGQ